MKESQEEKLFLELTRLYEETLGSKLPAAKHYPTGAELFSQGQAPKGIYYIRKGVVKISHHSQDEPVSVRLSKAHEFVGYLSLLKRWDYDSTATVVEPSEISFIPKETFLTALDKNIQFANLVLEMLCNRINDKNDLITDTLTKSAGQRLATLLLMLDHDPYDGKITLFKKDLASILNIKAETLSRNLLRLEKQHAIKLHSKTNVIEIMSRQKLLQHAQISD